MNGVSYSSLFQNGWCQSKRLNHGPSRIRRFGALDVGRQREDIIKLNQSAGLNAKADELLRIKRGQRDKNKFNQRAFTKMRILYGGTVGRFWTVAGWSCAQLFFKAVLQNGNNRIAAGDGGHAEVHEQVKSCHEAKRDANALG